MKPIEELIIEDSAWPIIQEWIDEAQVDVKVLENTKSDGEAALLRMQITNRSTMGAIALGCGGIVVDSGWLHILGSGHPAMYGSLTDNRQLPLLEEGYVIAYDAVGGLFAMNTGQFDAHSHNIYYFAPDTLEWEDTEKGYTDFMNWVFHGDLNLYYETFRWYNWQEDVKQLAPNQGISIFPYLWTKEGKDIENTHKQAIELKEIWGLQHEFRGALKRGEG